MAAGWAPMIAATMLPSALPTIARGVRERDAIALVVPAQKLLAPRRVVDVPLTVALVVLALI